MPPFLPMYNPLIPFLPSSRPSLLFVCTALCCVPSFVCFRLTDSIGPFLQFQHFFFYLHRVVLLSVFISPLPILLILKDTVGRLKSDLKEPKSQKTEPYQVPTSQIQEHGNSSVPRPDRGQQLLYQRQQYIATDTPASPSAPTTDPLLPAFAPQPASTTPTIFFIPTGASRRIFVQIRSSSRTAAAPKLTCPC